jgi:hypothetical protein
MSGRPRKFNSAKDMEEKINTYFVNENFPWTVSGLCIHLDIVRETLCQYEKEEEFSDTIKKAKIKIENYAEKLLFSSVTFTPGIVFNLKNNFGWKDKQEVESHNTNENTNINNNIDLSNLNKEEIRELLKRED